MDDREPDYRDEVGHSECPYCHADGFPTGTPGENRCGNCRSRYAVTD